jgi:hypothetical protein
MCASTKKGPSRQNSVVLNQNIEAIFAKGEGYIYKRLERGNFNVYYIALNKSMLYFYEEQSSPLPLEVIFIEGCYIEKLNDYAVTKKHGLKLTHHSETFREMSLYLDTA